MLIDGSASIIVGESFVEVDEDTASEFLNVKIKNESMSRIKHNSGKKRFVL